MSDTDDKAQAWLPGGWLGNPYMRPCGQGLHDDWSTLIHRACPQCAAPRTAPDPGMRACPASTHPDWSAVRHTACPWCQFETMLPAPESSKAVDAATAPTRRCTCATTPHALTAEQISRTIVAIFEATQAGNTDLVDCYAQRLEPCSTANPRPRPGCAQLAAERDEARAGQAKAFAENERLRADLEEAKACMEHLAGQLDQVSGRSVQTLREGVLVSAAEHLDGLYAVVYDDAGQKAADGVREAADHVRALVDRSTTVEDLADAGARAVLRRAVARLRTLHDCNCINAAIAAIDPDAAKEA